jgi:hypothetical protein
MMKTPLIAFLVVLIFIVGSIDLVRSENPQPDQDASTTFKVSEKNGNVTDDQDQFFTPIKPTNEGNFLILDPDGKTPSDYDKFLSPPDRLEKKSDR